MVAGVLRYDLYFVDPPQVCGRWGAIRVLDGPCRLLPKYPDLVWSAQIWVRLGQPGIRMPNGSRRCVRFSNSVSGNVQANSRVVLDQEEQPSRTLRPRFETVRNGYLSTPNRYRRITLQNNMFADIAFSPSAHTTVLCEGVTY